MIIKTPISLGELVDKISILVIKKKNITDNIKLDLINKELDFLNDTINKVVKEETIRNYLNQLIDINSKLWQIEDDIRECERKKIFNENFIQLARSVYITNDKRAEIKLKINQEFGSKIVEVKSYKKY